MEAVLYICHGSRVKEASDQAITFIKECMKESSYPIQEYSFLELSEPSIEEGFKACVAKGATTIYAVPVLLLTAAHAKVDIPEVLDELVKEFPAIQLHYGRPIGVHEKMAEIVAHKVKQSQSYKAKDALVLLVGRGSSDPDVKRDLREIGDMVESSLNGIKVEDCYLTAASPSFEDALLAANQSSYENIIVIPYLLFTGILMNMMKKTINSLSNAEKKYELCSYLGYHPFISSILKDRIKEAAEADKYVPING